ncbi:hypothetical protein PACTADRAFT_44574 [Pachysolen tannophilus NRRL Y-2460]|uniref:NAD-specific glutamate dehydrogenase n=1 Tax=Pachysolen tannophilus NRRL Y-2460 TaxID=669874 RepID=A0A1E4TRF2_PACTA|nr:hypothetical protein PACTADRAFT_44574 [Pachysolen tannophilus NRRL Y-2460]
MTSLSHDISKLTLNNNFSSSSFQNVSSEDLKTSGYKSKPFSGRSKQLEAVMDQIDSAGFIPENLIERETKWFYNSLGIDDVYFGRETVDGIVSHIHALYSAKLDAYSRGVFDKPFLHHKREGEDHAVYFETSNYNDISNETHEQRIDDRYLDNNNLDTKYRVESFTSPLIFGSNKNSNDINIRCHFVYKNSFAKDKVDWTTTDLSLIGDSTFLEITSDHTKKLYGEVIGEAVKTTGPVIKHFSIAHSNESRVIIGYRTKTSPRYNSALTTLCDFYKLIINRKYVENFANGVTVISMYISQRDHTDASDLSIYQVIKEASLLYSIPNNFFQDQFVKSELSLQECIYAHCGSIFVTHFLNRLGPEYNSLLSLLDPSKSIAHAEVLAKLRERLRSETFTQSYILEILKSQKNIVQQLYRQFADIHYIQSSIEKTLSYQRLTQIPPIENDEDFENILNRSYPQNEHHSLVLRALYTFNKAILKTNFFTPTKVAISFRLNANFLPRTEYPETPFGMFFVVGSEFRGFHIRFRDIARGGIRIVKSRSLDAYATNLRNLFDENYNLASTQQRKNKDIPEGGSKGVILLNPGVAQDNPKDSFVKYIDSLIDLLIDNRIAGVKEPIVDLYKKPEILFMGPDENTAGFVDWATLHARQRGAPWWKSFFTGKQLGGIPHDEYGMTSLSVRAYVEKIYEKFNISDKQITKFQTGGPDGDLGSNEILLSKGENYYAIVDGSGVIVDENGIDKNELIKLAESRKMISFFDKKKLSPKGYIVLVDDTDIRLPNGHIVINGTNFRNTFHLKIKEIFGPDKIKLFVPCGGRPNAIDTNTVHDWIDEKTGKCIIPYIVEGANLFITQSAKLILEKAGALIIKDASANKGGVTSSSLEVLASLSFNDEEFYSNMCLVDGKRPDFYKQYVKEVQKIIVKNARMEFDALWVLRETTNKPLAVLSNELSVAINKLGDELAASKELWEDELFKNKVLKSALPELLLNKLGYETIIQRVPEPYLKAIFATKLASSFIYTNGMDANPATFISFYKNFK